ENIRYMSGQRAEPLKGDPIRVVEVSWSVMGAPPPSSWLCHWGSCHAKSWEGGDGGHCHCIASASCQGAFTRKIGTSARRNSSVNSGGRSAVLGAACRGSLSSLPLEWTPHGSLLARWRCLQYAGPKPVRPLGRISGWQVARRCHRRVWRSPRSHWA